MVGTRETLPERIQRLIDEFVAAGGAPSRAQVLAAAGASSGWLSERLGVAKKNPDAGIKVSIAWALADVLGISLDELVGRGEGARQSEVGTDTLSMARDAADALARKGLPVNEAWFMFYDLPVAAYKGAPWTGLRMFEWALEQLERKEHPVGLAILDETSGPPSTPPPNETKDRHGIESVHIDSPKAAERAGAGALKTFSKLRDESRSERPNAPRGTGGANKSRRKSRPP